MARTMNGEIGAHQLPAASQQTGHRWTDILKGLDTPLSSPLTFRMKEFQKREALPGNVIELACGLHPSSDDFKLGSGDQRLLVDIADVQGRLNLNNKSHFVRADLNAYAKFHDANHPYRKALDAMGGHFGVLVVGSGLNYFDWKNALPILLEDLDERGLVFIYTGILERPPSGGKLAPLIDRRHRPKSPEEIRTFFRKLQYEIIEDTVALDGIDQEHLLLIARKTPTTQFSA